MAGKLNETNLIDLLIVGDVIKFEIVPSTFLKKMYFRIQQKFDPLRNYLPNKVLRENLSIKTDQGLRLVRVTVTGEKPTIDIQGYSSRLHMRRPSRSGVRRFKTNAKINKFPAITITFLNANQIYGLKNEKIDLGKAYLPRFNTSLIDFEELKVVSRPEFLEILEAQQPLKEPKNLPCPSRPVKKADPTKFSLENLPTNSRIIPLKQQLEREAKQNKLKARALNRLQTRNNGSLFGWTPTTRRKLGPKATPLDTRVHSSQPRPPIRQPKKVS